MIAGQRCAQLMLTLRTKIAAQSARGIASGEDIFEADKRATVCPLPKGLRRCGAVSLVSSEGNIPPQALWAACGPGKLNRVSTSGWRQGGDISDARTNLRARILVAQALQRAIRRNSKNPQGRIEIER